MFKFKATCVLQIDVDTFLHLRQADLEELGISDKALQFSILQKIGTVNNNFVG